MECITREDLTKILPNARLGNKIFSEVLEEVTTPQQLMSVLARYIRFNSVFGAGVASLAGTIALHQVNFLDRGEPELIADRSCEVASSIFAAAIDEFDDRLTPYLDTHRTLAQATLKGAADFFGIELSSMLPDLLDLRVDEAMVSVVRGYLMFRDTVVPSDIFKAIGFHMGSELLADQEFGILDEYLTRKHPDLVNYLKQTKVTINGLHHQAYYWVRVHTSVETDHFEAATVAANTALRYYAGRLPLHECKDLVLLGFVDFSKVQAKFMTSLR